MLALGAHYHGFHLGRRFFLWHVFRWGFGGGSVWHPLVLIGIVVAIIAALGVGRGGGRCPGPGSGSGRGMRRDASGRLEADRDLEERNRR